MMRGELIPSLYLALSKDANTQSDGINPTVCLNKLKTKPPSYQQGLLYTAVALFILVLVVTQALFPIGFPHMLEITCFNIIKQLKKESTLEL